VPRQRDALPCWEIGTCDGSNDSTRKGISGIKLPHAAAAMAAVFDDPSLVSCAGLLPVLALADPAGLSTLAGAHLSVLGDKGSNAGLKVA